MAGAGLTTRLGQVHHLQMVVMAYQVLAMGVVQVLQTHLLLVARRRLQGAGWGPQAMAIPMVVYTSTMLAMLAGKRWQMRWVSKQGMAK